MLNESHFISDVSDREHINFVRAVTEGNLEWRLLPVEAGPTITERYSHSSCYHERSMYVFGGCTFSSTTFNDLWRLDLGCGEWVRPLATGNFGVCHKFQREFVATSSNVYYNKSFHFCFKYY